MRVIEMDFLPDVLVACETCKGKRYNRETLEVRFRGKSIADILDMTVEEAVIFFQSQPKILRKIEMLDQVGLGYITLGNMQQHFLGVKRSGLNWLLSYPKKIPERHYIFLTNQRQDYIFKT